MESITCQWILTSTVDAWHFQLTHDRPYWEQTTPPGMRRIFHDTLSWMRSLQLEEDKRKVCCWNRSFEYIWNFQIATFKFLGRTLSGANPLDTVELFRQINGESDVDQNTKSKNKSEIIIGLADIQSHYDIFRRLQKDVASISSQRRP